jgi:H+-transporting ATPase
MSDKRIYNENPPGGLKEADLVGLRERYGFNEIPEFRENILLLYLKNFWGPLAWLMELMVVITFISGDRFEAIVIVCLLLVNAGINIFQRRSADAALAILRNAIQVTARVRRDGAWRMLPSRELLPGDVIRLRAGDIIPADAKLFDGNLSVDLSTLTGESLPRDVVGQDEIYSGGIVRHGEATATVSAIGKQTQYG